MRQALREAQSDRIAQTHENQRNRRSSLADRESGNACPSDDNLWTKRDQLSKERGDAVGPTLKVTILDLQILPIDIAVFAQSLQPALEQLGKPHIRENCDAMHRLLRLGLRRKEDQARHDHKE